MILYTATTKKPSPNMGKPTTTQIPGHTRQPVQCIPQTDSNTDSLYPCGKHKGPHTELPTHINCGNQHASECTKLTHAQKEAKSLSKLEECAWAFAWVGPANDMTRQYRTATAKRLRNFALGRTVKGKVRQRRINLAGWMLSFVRDGTIEKGKRWKGGKRKGKLSKARGDSKRDEWEDVSAEGEARCSVSVT